MLARRLELIESHRPHLEVQKNHAFKTVPRNLESKLDWIRRFSTHMLLAGVVRE